MPSLSGMTGAYVTAEGTLSGSGTQFTCTGDPFDIQPDLAYSTLINSSNDLAVKNASLRHAYSTTWTTPPTTGSAGWFDASAENGENRAHGLFVSALCNILKQRRGELSTAQTRDLVAEIRWGADFLLLMGVPENSDPSRYQKHDQQTPTWNKKLAGHHLARVSPPPLELAGHIFHEHHSRYPAKVSFDDDDNKNVALRVYVSALGLYDAARALRSFVQATSTTDAYFAQASDSRSYLYNLYLYWLIQSGNNPDFFLPYRSQAMLDVAAYDYSGLSSDLDGATQKMVNDLAGLPPTTSANIGKFWVLGGMFSNAPAGGAPDTSAYSPFEPILYFVEHGVPDLLPPAPPHPLWQDALYDIGELYYHQTILPGSGNPLRITRYWPTDLDANEFYGQDVFSNHKVAVEVYATARLAQNATRAGTNFDRLVQLATGDLNWILGLHRGALARQVQSSSGLVETDLGYSPVCMIANVGRRFGIQVVYGMHSADWTQPTTLSGLGGQLTDPTSSNPVVWPVAPFEFSRGQYNTTRATSRPTGTS